METKNIIETKKNFFQKNVYVSLLKKSEVSRRIKCDNQWKSIINYQFNKLFILLLNSYSKREMFTLRLKNQKVDCNFFELHT